MMNSLELPEAHFAFGKNWASYAKLIDESQIRQAKKGLLKLIPVEAFNERSFLDIGCGSGLHALAASRLDVSNILAVDIDSDSVATTRAILEQKGVTQPWSAETKSVFNLDPEVQGTFDIVYSWGVLHHTGNMWAAIDKAAAMVSPNGIFAMALYRATYMDAFWKFEKRIYAHAPAFIQTAIRATYLLAFRLGKIVQGNDYRKYIADYVSLRGMDFYHDVHDWLGGYPYETATADEVDERLTRLGFKAERVFVQPKTLGLFGSGCDEYVYRLRAS